MKISCDVIKDLLPLYIDNVCSDDTRKLIEEHLEECENCKKEYDLLSNGNYLNESQLDEIKIVKEASKVMKKEKRKSFIYGNILIIILSLIVFLLISSMSFNPSNIIFTTSGVNYNKAEIKVSYDNPFFVCTYEDEENLGYNYIDQYITVNCTNKFMPEKKYTYKEQIINLHRLDDVPICILGDRWIKAGIPDNMVAIYKRNPSKQYNNVSGAFVVIVKTDEGYTSFLEEDVYSDLNTYEQPVIYKYKNKLKTWDIDIKEYQPIDNLEEFINQIKSEGFTKVTEDYENGLAIWTCY